ncbi:MAG TPA: two-component regulator propeller domain-containing protein [Stenotrophomonas sp.]
MTRCLALLLLGCCTAASALSPDRAISQLRHDRWTPDEGAPAQIMSITQSPDGFLWLGSRQGLYRFDGLHFERITQIAGEAIVDDDVLSVMAEADGSVWVGFINGGMSRMGGPHPLHYKYERDDVPAGSVLGFARDAAGRLWTATPATAVRLDPATDTWKTADDMGFDPTWSPQSIFVDRDKGLWIAYAKAESFGIAYLAPGASKFTLSDHPIQMPYLNQAPDGAIWAADYWGVRPLAQAKPDKRNARAAVSWLAPDFKGAGLRFDRDGAMWLSTESGIARVRDPRTLQAPSAGHSPPQPEYFGLDQGLTAQVVWTIFEDREGNIWTGTANGLDRFRENALVPIRLPRREQAFLIESDQAGRIWAGNADRGPMRITPDASQPGGALVEEVLGIGQGVTALHRDAAGTLWIGGSAGGLWRSDKAGLQRVRLPDDLIGSGYVSMLTSDREGGLWMTKLDAGLLRFHDGQWERQNAKYGLLAGTTPRALVEDAQGRIWSDAGQTIRVFENGVKRDLKEDGPGIGRISVLQMHGSELWAGGLQGVSIKRAEHFERLLGRDGEKFERTLSIIILADGEAWLGGRADIARIPASEMTHWRADPNHRVDFEKFGALDGLRGAAEQNGASPKSLLDGQGRVWFATDQGVHWIDPKHITRNPASTPPKPVVLAVQVDEQALPLASPMQLPVGSRDLRIDYTVPALRMPERVRFRYRLEGLDEDWQLADGRQALYSRLQPGTYHFRLNASDDAGHWSNQETALAITVSPAFWQTWWFALACGLAALVLVWWLVRWRVAIARTRVQRVYRARIGERERIARDLHDTLLQSVQALVFRIQTALGRLEQGDAQAAEQGLSRALQEANEGLTEGRDRIHELRSQAAEFQDLESALRELPLQLEIPPEITYAFRTRGVSRHWRPAEQAELYRIAREAVSNALRHAGASQIELHLTYGLLSTVLEIRDNGCGIAPDVLKHGSRDGHWGLTGMRERAALLGGKLTVMTPPHGGTCISLRVPSWR